jgi:hypothetical protein
MAQYLSLSTIEFVLGILLFVRDAEMADVLSAVSGFAETNCTLLTDIYYKYRDKGSFACYAALGLLLCIVLVHELNCEFL